MGDTWFSPSYAIPSNFSVRVVRSRVKALNGEEVLANSSLNGSEIPNQTTSLVGFGASWDWGWGTTDLDLVRSLLDTRQAGRETADTDERSLDIIQTYFSDFWDLTARVGIGRNENKEVNTRSIEYRYEGGVSLGFRLDERFPNLFTSFDASLNDTAQKVAGNHLLINTWRSSTTLDFSKFIPDVLDDYQPYAELTYLVAETDTRDPVIGPSSQYSYALTISTGFRF